VPVLPYAGRVLDYAVPLAGGTVVVARCANIAEAELRGGVLEGEGIPYQVHNVNTANMGVYTGGWTSVELHVRREDADRATEVLSRYADDADLEPVEEAPGVPPPVDETGRPIELAVAAAYDSARLMQDAATVLAAARVRFYIPTLAPRGDRPRGEGRRFVIRVAEEDLERALAVLDEAEEEAGDEDEPRCPRCRSWRVHPVSSSGLGRAIGQMLGLVKPLPFQGKGFECLACRHRGPREEFLRDADADS
jgi:hypothetical protein